MTKGRASHNLGPANISTRSSTLLSDSEVKFHCQYCETVARQLGNWNKLWQFLFVLLFYFIVLVKDRTIGPYESVAERIPLAFVFLMILFEKLRITITFSNFLCNMCASATKIFNFSWNLSCSYRGSHIMTDRYSLCYSNACNFFRTAAYDPVNDDHASFLVHF